MLPPAERWARIGPTDRAHLIHVPEAGLCLSAFLIVYNNDSEILLGLPRDHIGWEQKGGYPRMQASQLGKERLWLLPATHLLVEESPDKAANRIAHEWAGLRDGKPNFFMLQSHLRPSTKESLEGKKRNSQGTNHWDVCFVYKLQATKKPVSRPWWKEVKFVPIDQLSKTKIGRGHADILTEAGVI